MLLGGIGDLNVQLELAQIGYAVPLTGQPDDATKHAALAFERRFGLPQSEDIQSPTLRAGLSFVADRLTEAGIRLPDRNVFTDMWNGPGAAVHAQGTWSPATPATQTSDIWCYRSQDECHETLAMLDAGALSTDIVDYKIIRWDHDEIVARSEAPCGVDEITITRIAGNVILNRMPLLGNNNFCRELAPPDSEAIARLVDGRTVTRPLAVNALLYLRLGPVADSLVQNMRRRLASEK